LYAPRRSENFSLRRRSFIHQLPVYNANSGSTTDQVLIATLSRSPELERGDVLFI
jgi:hypothetical protein